MNYHGSYHTFTPNNYGRNQVDFRDLYKIVPNIFYQNQFPPQFPLYVPVYTPPVATIPFRSEFVDPPKMAFEVPYASAQEYNEFDEKEVAFKRFRQNNVLMNQIMSDVMVPCGTPPVTSTKLNALQRQVEALKRYQKKEEAELVDVERKHNATLQDIKQRKESFEQVYQKFSRRITDPQINKLSNAIYQRFQAKLNERLERKKQKEQSSKATLQSPESLMDTRADILGETGNKSQDCDSVISVEITDQEKPI